MEYRYSTETHHRFRFSLSDVARELETTVQRVSRTIKRMDIPVRRFGNMVTVDPSGLSRLRKAIKKADVTRPKS